MATPITSSLVSQNFKYPFLLNSQSSFFRFDTKYQSNPLETCYFFPSYSIGNWPDITNSGPFDLNVFNGFPIGSPSAFTNGYRYQYGFDSASNRQCYFFQPYFDTDDSIIPDNNQTQGIPLHFYEMSGSNGSVSSDPNQTVIYTAGNGGEFEIYGWGNITNSWANNQGQLGAPIASSTNWNVETGAAIRCRTKEYILYTPPSSNINSNYSTASFRFKIGIKANPDFPQRLYAGRLDIAFIMPKNSLPEDTNPNSDGFVYYNDIYYNTTGPQPIPEITQPFNYVDLTTYGFAQRRPVNSFGSQGNPPQQIATTYIPLVASTFIDNIEMGPGLSGSYESDEVIINLKSNIFKANYLNPDDQSIKSFGLVGRFSFLTDEPVSPPASSAEVPELWLISFDPNGNIVPVQKINDTPFTTGSNSFNKTIQLSSSALQIENYRLGIAAKYFGFDINSPYFDSLNITSFDVTTTVAPQSNTPDEVILGSSFEEDFTNNDWNALFGNASLPRDSQYFMDIDYSDSSVIGSSLTPINFDSIIENTAVRAPIQDYYYNLQRHIIPRYNGSRSNSPDFNLSSNDNSGYGDEIVAGNPKPFIGYYTSKGGSTPEVIGKTIVNLDYIIDENLVVQVPALSDFTYNNQIQLFERGKYLYLDPDKNSIPFPLAGSIKYKIYRSGEFATPVIYSQTGSISAIYRVNPLSFFDSTGSQVNVNYTPTSKYVLDISINQTGSNNIDFNNTNYPSSFPDPNTVFSLYSQGEPDPNPYLPNGNPDPAYSASISGGTVGRIRLNTELSNLVNKNYLYKTVEGSGYYDTVDYFNLNPIYPEIAAIPEYEIRFNADERLAFPIISVFQTSSYGYVDLYISVPSNFEEIWGTFPIPITYGAEGSFNTPPPRPNFLNAIPINSSAQNFLIRRWVPRAGYIYLDVDASLGKGIIKPEFITKGIEDKISSIIKNLTNEGLITSDSQIQ